MTQQERINPLGRETRKESVDLRPAFPVPLTGRFEDLLKAIDAAESSRGGSIGGAQPSRSP
ncbi:MAG: hypothetical protein AVDCRST_MAG93-5107 [uncultured Chloroflexia bacterium]|uniref:Uncharacterized protein n=1 Tax=uncultured Chloroflexia bacterium TaxID=1672391 RepID=A0A6J4KLB3_9CHLR|nr:MAG: hypothetical protein AVDCRST_MAG93-5107 [uncultured Chloroflexia bacterium]